MTNKQTDIINRNLDWWTKLAPIDDKFLKKITGKRYQGSSIDPIYMMRKFTEVFGPAGLHWTFNVEYQSPVFLDDGCTILVFSDVSISMFPTAFDGTFDNVDEGAVPLIIGPERGCDYLRKKESKGPFIDDDAYKKATTDAMTKLMSRVGNCSDLFMGLHDDKYRDRSIEDNRPTVTDAEWEERFALQITIARSAKNRQMGKELYMSQATQKFFQTAPIKWADLLKKEYASLKDKFDKEETTDK